MWFHLFRVSILRHRLFAIILLLNSLGLCLFRGIGTSGFVLSMAVLASACLVLSSSAEVILVSSLTLLVCVICCSLFRFVFSSLCLNRLCCVFNCGLYGVVFDSP